MFKLVHWFHRKSLYAVKLAIPYIMLYEGIENSKCSANSKSEGTFWFFIALGSAIGIDSFLVSGFIWK